MIQISMSSEEHDEDIILNFNVMKPLTLSYTERKVCVFNPQGLQNEHTGPGVWPEGGKPKPVVAWLHGSSTKSLCQLTDSELGTDVTKWKNLPTAKIATERSIRRQQLSGRYKSETYWSKKGLKKTQKKKNVVYSQSVSLPNPASLCILPCPSTTATSKLMAQKHSLLSSLFLCWEYQLPPPHHRLLGRCLEGLCCLLSSAFQSSAVRCWLRTFWESTAHASVCSQNLHFGTAPAP